MRDAAQIIIVISDIETLHSTVQVLRTRWDRAHRPAWKARLPKKRPGKYVLGWGGRVKVHFVELGV